jgi:ribosome-associated translation inhibitor RaiA
VYQIYIQEKKEEGLGELYAAFIELKAKLEKQGLFEEAKKLPIPKYPRKVGVITSPTGAAVRDIINSFNMNGTHDEGDINDRDSKTFNTEKGFSLILTLPLGFDNAKDAIDKAIEDTVFAKPDNYNCNYIGMSLSEKDYMIDDVRSCFDKVYKTTYKTYNTKGHNTVVLSGCATPNEIITTIKQKLEELNSDKEDVSEKIDLTVNLTNTINKSDNVKVEKNTKVTFTEMDLDDIASAIDDLF